MFTNEDPDVRVHHLKEQMAPAQQEALLQDLTVHSERVRPRVVLNCSAIRRLNHTTVMLLLSCLEVAMMGNGDVRLAEVSPVVEAKLWLAGITELFELHSTAESAVQSFHRRPYSVAGMQEKSTIFIRHKVAA